jgi:thymidylate synthase ThyX
MIKAEIIADSISDKEHRITTMLLTYPRFIHGEVMTHRVFSRNSASSRAIPFEKMVKMVEENPFIPIAWQKDHKGMQGTEYIADKTDINLNENAWLMAMKDAVSHAKYLNHGVKDGRDNGVTKQLCNRLLEPFMWHTTLVTATEFENFFELRNPVYEIDLDNLESLKD